MSFDVAIHFVIQHEGGYSNDKYDRGGETLYGLSRASYPDLDFRTLTVEKAEAIYRRDFWDALSLDDFPDKLATAVFDTAVNAGHSRAVKILQESINRVDCKELEVDGRLGPATKQAAMDSSDAVVIEYLLLRARFYRNLVKQNPSQSKFLMGWLNRVFDLHDLLLP